MVERLISGFDTCCEATIYWLLLLAALWGPNPQPMWSPRLHRWENASKTTLQVYVNDAFRYVWDDQCKASNSRFYSKQQSVGNESVHRKDVPRLQILQNHSIKIYLAKEMAIVCDTTHFIPPLTMFLTGRLLSWFGVEQINCKVSRKLCQQSVWNLVSFHLMNDHAAWMQQILQECMHWKHHRSLRYFCVGKA